MKKVRLDSLLLERELAASEKEAHALILAGEVLVDDVPLTAVGHAVSPASEIRLRRQKQRYVSRGGLKLEYALGYFRCEVKGKIALDAGAATGGFTDCLLQHGAAKVYAVDVGYGVLDLRLRRDPRVVVIERCHVRQLTRREVPDAVDILTLDLSFISAATVLPPIARLLADRATIIVLVKPQFEADRRWVEKGGLVRDPAAHDEALSRVGAGGRALGWELVGSTASPILGAKGNQEFLLCFAKRK